MCESHLFGAQINFFLFLFFFFKGHTSGIWSYQDRGRIGTVAAGLCSHRNLGYELHL